MEHVDHIILCAAILIMAHVAVGQIASMSVQGSNDIREKLQPVITEISKELALALGKGPETQSLFYELVTKDIDLALRKLPDSLNITAEKESFPLCCNCLHCLQYKQECGKMCCTNGYGGCVCRSCTTGESLEVNDVGKVTPAITLWIYSAKDKIKTDVSALLEEISFTDNGKCCLCAICKKTAKECFIKACCVQGGKLCKCFSCSSGKFGKITDDTGVSVLQSKEVQAALANIDSFIDTLPFLVYNK